MQSLQASTRHSEADGGPSTRRGHISISDPSHHVTEAIGHMYDDDDYDQRDSRRLSYLCSPLSESISVSPIAKSPTSPQDPHSEHPFQPNGQSRPPLIKSNLHDKDSNPASPGSDLSPGETATAPFPLNDIGYESDPAAVAQELSNLAAIRRMSMDSGATGDPDLPSFGSNFSVPSLPPSPSADENDASRLFWVPARLHPELAPMEFKSFLESKAEQIKRKSGDFTSLGQDLGGGLQRKKSMLSRQIDNPNGYTDGAERLERKRSEAKRSPNLQDLETLVDGSKQLNKEAASLLQGIQDMSMSGDEDRPILPPAPPGHNLRRSTRTQYRKGGSKKGEKIPYSSRRHVKVSEASETGKPPRIQRVATDPTPSANGAQTASWPRQSSAHSSGSSPTSTPEWPLDQKESKNRASQPVGSQSSVSPTSNQTDAGNRASAPPQKQWQSRISSNGRSTIQIPPSAQQKAPEIVETSPAEANRAPLSPSQQSHKPDRESPLHTSSPSLPPQGPPIQEHGSKKSTQTRQPAKESRSSYSGITNSPQAIPGNNTRTDSLSIIPTMHEEKKSESKKSKDKKEEGGRKSSWHWLLGSEEKDKDKKKEKDSDSKRQKTKSVDKGHDGARLDVLQSSIDGGPRRESLVLDRLDPKLEEERRKDSVRRSSGEAKKEKESGLFSSIFGGGKKKSSGDGHHKKNTSRNLSPEPLVRELRPDIDYPWTRFSILEERAIYRMAHIKLANPRRALYSQVLLSNFMYSYLAKVQQMHPTMMMAAAAAQRQQKANQPDEYLQYQRYQEAQQQQLQYGDNSYDNSQMYDYDHDNRHNSYGSRGSTHGYESGTAYGPGHYQQYNDGHSSFGDEAQLDDDDDDMW